MFYPFQIYYSLRNPQKPIVASSASGCFSASQQQQHSQITKIVRKVPDKMEDLSVERQSKFPIKNDRDSLMRKVKYA